jgi:group II intron reverse transcriptase/maturase
LVGTLSGSPSGDAGQRVCFASVGKRTPGVDGVASLTPRQRMRMVEDLRNLTHHTPAPLRRVYIPKPGKKEMRGLSIPTMLDRALQALVKLALEPEWEARFEPNSCGFRPGRSSHDAIESVFNFIRLKPKYVLDADITKCFDRISHDAILDKLHTIRPIERLVRSWLKAGIVDHGETIFPEAGAAQGGPLSPLLANVALHGLETVLRQAAPAKSPPGVIRYADDFVVLHHDLDTLHHLKTVAAEWLAEIGLQLHPEKTLITHTLEPHDGRIGFDFGWNIRLGLSRTAVSDGQASHSHLPGQTRLQDLHRTQSQSAATPTGQAAGHHPTSSRGTASRSRLCPQSCDPGLGQLLPVLRRQTRFPNPGQHPLPPTHPLGQTTAAHARAASGAITATGAR